MRIRHAQDRERRDRRDCAGRPDSRGVARAAVRALVLIKAVLGLSSDSPRDGIMLFARVSGVFSKYSVGLLAVAAQLTAILFMSPLWGR